MGEASLVGRSESFRQRLGGYFARLHQTSGHYRAAMAGRQLSPAAEPFAILGAMPVTEKSTYRDALQAEALAGLERESFVTDFSSGSTAHCVLRLCRPADDLAEQEVTEAAFRRAGLGPGDRFVCLDVGAPEIYDFYFRAARNLGVARCAYLHMNRDAERACRPLRGLAPTVLLSVPSILIRAWPHIAGIWRGEAAPIRALIHMGEAMHPAFRAEVEAAWGCRVHSFYGTTEIGGLGVNCAESDGIHFDPSDALPTIEAPRWLDAETVEGEILFTTPSLHTQGVVKYRVGDRARLTVAPCACGDPTPRLWFLGRTHDAFVIAGEKFHHDAILEALRQAAPDLRMLSIEVMDSAAPGGHCLLRLTLPEALADRAEALLDILRYEIFELDSIYRYGLVDFDLAFVPAAGFEGRKLRRVVDRRRHMAGQQCPSHSP